MSTLAVANLVPTAWRSLCALWQPLFFYNLFFQLLSVVVLVPVTAGAGEWIIARSGKLAVSNTAILTFLLSPLGLAWIAVASSLTLALIFATSSGMLRIAWSYQTGTTMSAKTALVLTVRSLPALTKLAVLQVRAHLIRLTPAAALIGVIYLGLLSSYDIYYLVRETPPVWWWAMALVALVGLVILWVNGRLYLRWLLSLPAMLYEQTPPGEALSQSENLMQGQTWGVLRPIIAATGLLMVSPLLVTGTFDVLGVLVFNLVPERMAAVLPALMLFLGAYLVAAVATGFVVVAFHALIVAHLYRSVREGEGRSPLPVDPPDKTATERGAVPILSVLGIGFAAAIGVGVHCLAQIDLEHDLAITAHQGSSLRAPENSVPAIELAIEEGAQICELDFMELGDGTVVMMHDTDFRRIAGLAKSVWEVSYGDVNNLDVGSWFAPEYSHLRLMRLAEVLRLARGRIVLNIELKFHGREKEFVPNVVKALREADFKDDCVVTSLDIGGLNAFRKLAPEFSVGAILAQTIGRPMKLDADLLAVPTRMATPDFIDAAHRANKEVHVWTVNRPSQMARLFDLGVDSIMTDDPLLLAEVIAERAAMSREAKLLLRVRALLLH